LIIIDKLQLDLHLQHTAASLPVIKI